ncbi:MAG: hypothetical protein DRJ65_15360 [Acidobacteria bacterium]|nr:MAG: hypothetical protein DRJ65_15360 [Acidobacteriota bacterium]
MNCKYSDRPEMEREWLEENTWCDDCGKPDLGMNPGREYEENGRTFVEGVCKVCGCTVRSEIITKIIRPEDLV